MKTHFKHFIFNILVIISVSAQAQSFTSKGTVELGGEFSFTSQTESRTSSSIYPSSHGESYNVLMFSPYVGAMVGQGFELGFMPAIASSGSYTSLNLFFAPAYNINTGGNAYPFFEGLIGYSSLGSGKSISGLGVGASAGVKVAIGSSGLFLFDIKYLHQSYTYDESYYNYAFNGNSYYGYNTSVKVTETINTIFAGIGFRIFISKSAKKNSVPVK